MVDMLGPGQTADGQNRTPQDADKTSEDGHESASHDTSYLARGLAVLCDIFAWPESGSCIVQALPDRKIRRVLGWTMLDISTM